LFLLLYISQARSGLPNVRRGSTLTGGSKASLKAETSAKKSPTKNAVSTNPPSNGSSKGDENEEEEQHAASESDYDEPGMSDRDEQRGWSGSERNTPVSGSDKAPAPSSIPTTLLGAAPKAVVASRAAAPPADWGWQDEEEEEEENGADDAADGTDVQAQLPSTASATVSGKNDGGWGKEASSWDADDASDNASDWGDVRKLPALPFLCQHLHHSRLPPLPLPLPVHNHWRRLEKGTTRLRLPPMP
jgi:hypothetical protein